ncbi:hypothetical protein [Frigoriglobus tundricola]|uniref:Uncharacterized protein n=1 Tax=Frigoriglobus tundricola TaxID=2774151 RepID=A0A6M5YJH8_9BACT|nr:hypothetical protein [Frigoriglobus tundricola]QJW93500.1 hypothetical protein FTUN_1006 [Frigoriglobus tundricola]
MPKTTAKPEATVEEAMERLRQAAIEARSSSEVAEEAQKAVEHLNELYAANKEAFTAEDVRFANVLRGALGARLAAHGPKVAHTKKAKRKGDKLDHCWRCLTPVDERFSDNCPQCSEKAYQWRICPVCNACGCQRAGKVLI